jgi:hypothetical protein
MNDPDKKERPPDPPAMKPHGWCAAHACELSPSGKCPLCYAKAPTENDRWWQAFCAAYRPAVEVKFTDPKPSLEEAAQLCAEGGARGADAMIAEAKKRGRL